MKMRNSEAMCGRTIRLVVSSMIVISAILIEPQSWCARAQAGSQKPDKPVPARSSKGAGGATGVLPKETIMVGDQVREYRLIVPKSVDGTKPVPLVFAFHGLGDSKDLMPIYSQLDKLAEKHGFVLVFPNGLKRHWQIVPAWAKGDVAFYDKLYEQITGKYNIDLNRVYLTGMSNGAYFSHVIASQRSEQIAAIAPHSGGPGIVGAQGINANHKYAVFVIHGDSDSIVPVEEGRRTRDNYTKWGHEVEYLEVPKHNHFWANSADVNTKIWEFFEKHPLSQSGSE